MWDDSSSSEEYNVSQSEDICSTFLGLRDFTIFTASHGELRLVLSRVFFSVFRSVFHSVFHSDVMTRQQKIQSQNTEQNLLDSE